MSKRETYEEKTEKLLLPIVQANQVEIYDVEYVKEGSDYYLRCYIDKEGGVNINDCEAVSRALSDELDREDFIEETYILEVSSPGLGRALKKDKHLEKSILKDVDIRTYKPMEGSKEFTGKLMAFDKDTVTLELDSGSGVREMVFNRKDIAAMKLALDF
ncbi:MAG: ribosome maturation factor RimP [Lachnospiraceae bacterium]|nr:ribosome maturation factor RimP [Lachnospiraceae bacterium]